MNKCANNAFILTNKLYKSTLFLTNARIMAFKPYAKKGRRICACYLK